MRGTGVQEVFSAFIAAIVDAQKYGRIDLLQFQPCYIVAPGVVADPIGAGEQRGSGAQDLRVAVDAGVQFGANMADFELK